MTEQESTTREMSKHYRRRRGTPIPKRLEVLHPDAAGIDIGAQHHYVSVPEDRDEETIRRFGCYTPQLEEMAQWLKQCGVKTDVSILIHPRWSWSRPASTGCRCSACWKSTGWTCCS